MPQAAIAYLCEINKGTPTKDGIPVLTQVCDEITVLLMLLFTTRRPIRRTCGHVLALHAA